jgi:hypothetical protein
VSRRRASIVRSGVHMAVVRRSSIEISGHDLGTRDGLVNSSKCLEKELAGDLGLVVYAARA